jgi:hypothetical protein
VDTPQVSSSLGDNAYEQSLAPVAALPTSAASGMKVVGG